MYGVRAEARPTELQGLGERDADRKLVDPEQNLGLSRGRQPRTHPSCPARISTRSQELRVKRGAETFGASAEALGSHVCRGLEREEQVNGKVHVEAWSNSSHAT